METGHPSTRAVNSGSGNRALVINITVDYAITFRQARDCLPSCRVYIIAVWPVPSWRCSSVIERRSLTSELSLACTGPAADG